MVEPGEHGIEALAGFAKEIIKGAGREALGFYGKGDPHLPFDEGLVTEAELHLDQFFQKELGSRFPDHRIFHKCRMEKNYSHGEKRYVWIYDALEGIANFQAGIPIWGISLALLENFWPIFGIFYMPVTGDLFHAQAGSHAFRNDEQIHVLPPESISDESRMFTYSRFHHHYRSSFPGKVLNLGCTSAHICYVAKGRAHAAVLANESFQDLAATRVIIEAAGGKIFRMDGKELFLNEYLDGQKIDDHLLVLHPRSFSRMRKYLEPS
jgi:myo-inositol-1(or 4)-monophosphatase